jgi:hypothetical protein
LYWGTIGKYPQVAMARSLPKDAPESITLTPNPSPKEGEGKIKILARDWMWRGMVVVL